MITKFFLQLNIKIRAQKKFLPSCEKKSSFFPSSSILLNKMDVLKKKQTDQHSFCFLSFLILFKQNFLLEVGALHLIIEIIPNLVNKTKKTKTNKKKQQSLATLLLSQKKTKPPFTFLFLLDWCITLFCFSFFVVVEKSFFEKRSIIRYVTS